MKKKGTPALLRNIVGQNVRVYRAAKGVSQEALAERCGIKRSYIGAIERAEVDMRLMTLSKLAVGLGVEVYRLLIDAEKQLRSNS
jgi:transcriptional regulator with XRE-family HTH domain